MDDKESPTNDLQVNFQDFLQTDASSARTKECLPPSPDENENNPLTGSKHNSMKSSDDTMGRVEQDSINNNAGEDSDDYTACCLEDKSDDPCRNCHAAETLILGICTPGQRSSRKLAESSIRKDVPPSASSAAKQEKTDITDGAKDEDENEANANCPHKEPKHTLQALFSLLREEFERMDLRVLPLCLHQIAETYFQDGEYEKAMKFIQLERLYHEQLLANLSSIQQQWEKKWKASASSENPSLKNSAKDLNNEELDKLAELCTSHQEPFVSRNKLIPEENSWGHDNVIGLIGSEDLKAKGPGTAATCDSDAETWSGIEPSKENYLKERERSENFHPDSCHTLRERTSLQQSVGKNQMEEEQGSADSTLEQSSQLPGTLGTPHTGWLSSGETSEASRALLREKQFPEDVARIKAAAEEPAAKCPSEPMVDPFVLVDADCMPPDLISTAEHIWSERNLFSSEECPGSTVICNNQLGSNIVNQEQQTACGADKKPVQGRTSSDSDCVCAASNAPEQLYAVYAKVSKGIQETTELEEERENEGKDNFFDQFLNGGIKEESLESQGDCEILLHMPSEQALYSSSESCLLEESLFSLDELAKRIEVAQNVPAEGLVSILKKKDDGEGKTVAQIPQRPSKRRVRFQEMEDTLDPEDVGGGSCILLILLCLATVFLSIGGTAVYCTLGNMESPEINMNTDSSLTIAEERGERLHNMALSESVQLTTQDASIL